MRLQFKFSRAAVYQVVCERLEMLDRIVDAFDCSQQMMSKFGGETNLPKEHLEWARGGWSYVE